MRVRVVRLLVERRRENGTRLVCAAGLHQRDAQVNGEAAIPGIEIDRGAQCRHRLVTTPQGCQRRTPVTVIFRHRVEISR